jgi:hypothetical protein
MRKYTQIKKNRMIILEELKGFNTNLSYTAAKAKYIL